MCVYEAAVCQAYSLLMKAKKFETTVQRLLAYLALLVSFFSLHTIHQFTIIYPHMWLHILWHCLMWYSVIVCFRMSVAVMVW